MAQNGSAARRNHEKMVEAAEVYLLMKEEYRISRNTRAAWFFNHLNKPVVCKKDQEVLQSDEDLEVLSVLPSQEETPENSNYEANPACELVASTHVSFLARRYRMVFIFDFSPSMASVDIQLGQVNIMNSFNCLSNCLRGLIQPFHVPGSSLILSPKIYITVIAYTPVSSLTTQQVLVQGRLVTADVVEDVLQNLQQQVENFENKLFSCINKEDPDSNGYFLSPQSSGTSQPSYEMAFPESCFMNMLWCGYLALQLLPVNTSAGLVMISDGVIGVREDPILNNALAQLRDSTIACSFIQVGHGFLPHSGFGYIPHTEIMQFIATATLGSFLDQCPLVPGDDSGEMNIYHTALLLWSFQKDLNPLKGYQQSLVTAPSLSEPSSSLKSIGLRKPRFPNLPLQRVKHREETLQTDLFNVMAVRLREGYTIKHVSVLKSKGLIEVRLALPCTHSGQIEYVARGPWPPLSNRKVTYIEVFMEGTYDFVHDINCPLKKTETRSIFKTRVIKNFWQMMRSLRDTDKLLVHMQSFAVNPAYYVVPEGTSKGMPLFYMPPNSDKPVLSLQHAKKDDSLSQFAQFWKRIALMEPKQWQRWLHTHRIAMLLMPDLPLPKHLHHPNTSGRFGNVQCKLAQKELNALLTDWATFILLENHSYINITYEDKNSPPTSFFIIRVICKGLTVVLRLAFLGGTPAYVRNKIVNELKEKLAGLSMSQKLIHSKDPTRIAKGRKLSVKGEDPKPTLKKPCVLLLRRPVEVILVKYEKMPTDFTDLKLSSEVTAPSVPVYMNRGPDKKLNRLSCYLHHRRWIWDAQGDQAIQISSQTVLSVLTRFKLLQDFRIAYSQSGIISFIAELNLKSVLKALPQGDTFMEESHVEAERDEKSTPTDEENMLQEAEDAQEGSTPGEGACEGEVFKCLVQFVIFPPHVETLTKVQDPGDDEDIDMSEADGKLQLITECWVEPQCGTIIDSPAGREFFNGQQYMNVPDLLFPSDDEIIRTLLSYEHLKAMCNKESKGIPVSPQLSSTPCVSITESIHHLPFSLDILQLIPKCRELEMMCSTFLEGLIPVFREGLQYPQPNETLFNLLLSSLSEDGTTNFELNLTKDQSLQFCDMILRKDYSERDPPFKMTQEEVSAIMSDVGKLNSQKKTSARSGSELGESRGNWRRPRAETIDEADVLPKIPQWTCFVRSFSSDTLLLVILPASYKELIKLQGKTHAPLDAESDSSSLSGTGGDKNASKEKPVTEGLEEKSKVQASKASKTLKTGKEGKPDPVSKGKRKKLKKLRHHSEEEPKISHNLPIYVYECTLSSLTNYLLKKDTDRVQKDVLKDITFASMERINVPGTPRSSRRLGRIPSDSDEFSEASKKALSPLDNEKPQMSREMEWFFCLLSNKVQKAFVVAVFKSLQQGQNIDRKDVLAAIDNICVESLSEIDITNYVQAVCGHVRDTCETFCEESGTKDSFRKQLKFAEDTNTMEENKEDDAECQSDKVSKEGEGLSSPVIKKEVICRIPVAAFLARQTCEVQTGLHNLIKTKFTQIMGSYFKQIPSNENLWFYCSHDIDDLNQYSTQSQTTTQDEVETSGTEFLAEKDLLQADGKTQLTDIPHSENTSESNTSSKEEDRKINSIVDNYLILKQQEEFSDELSDDGRTSIMSQCGSMEEEISPLFVTLVCTIKHKSNVGNMPVQTIPTCLGVLLDCLERPEEEIVLGDLRLTLDLICLTLPPDFDVCTPYDEEGSEHSDRRRGTSFTEPSPPDSPPAEIIRQNLRSGFKLSLSEFDDFNNDFVDDTLDSLPEHQKNSIKATQEEIKWLLKDEIASARRHIFPVTTTTLDMVADHVCNSLGKDTCLHQQVDLKFVFGPEQSLAEFVKAFEEITVAGYKLNKIHDNYYLSLDQMASDKDLDGSWPSDQLEAHLPLVSKSGISINISGSTSDVTTKITFTPPSPQKYLGPVLKDKGEEERETENVPSQVEVFEMVAEKLTESAGSDGSTLQECTEEPQKTQSVVKENKKDSPESEARSEKKVDVDDTEKDVRDDGEDVDEGGEKETWKGARKIEGISRKVDEMQDSNKSSLVSSEWQSASESLTNQTESDSDSDIQVLTDEDGREAEDGMKLESRGLVVGSLEEDEDSQRTLTRTSGILVLKKGEIGSNQTGGDDTDDGISPAKWSNSESGILGSESSVSSQQRSDSSLGFATEGLSQFMEVIHSDGTGSEIQGSGGFDPSKVKRVTQQDGKQFEDRSDGNHLGKVQGANETKTSVDGASKPETQDSSKVKTTETEEEKSQCVVMPQKHRNSSGDSSNTFSPRDQDFPSRDDSPQGQAVVSSRDSSNTTHRVGRTRDTPGSRHTSSTGGTTISGPLSAQVSCNSLSGSLTECDEEGYEAGSSEDEFGDSHVFSEDDFNAKQKMPDFWLILKIQEDKEELENENYKMNMYFHTRDRGDGVRLQAQKATFDQVANAIHKTCRLVSQHLLLIDLFDSKVCNPLLLADDENWNKEIDYNLPTRGRFSSDSGPDMNVMVERDYLAARLDFDPGHFACTEQFTAHLVVHSRLPSTRMGTGKMSGGMQAVKTALEAFSISNRPDLYVVKDDSGEVFYIRLSERASSNVHPTSSRVSVASDSLPSTEPGSLQVSRAPSVQNLVTDDELPPPSSVTDIARDSIPESSKGPTIHSRTISVSIYGLKKPGPEIHRDLISLLQKRLDQVTLDVIKDMLDKNAMSRLTVADVQFIQPPGKAPTRTVQFTIPLWSIRYIFATGFYLQQNLLEFLYVPKYVDSRPLYHFQDYTLKDKGPERPFLLERDTFLYNRPHRAGGTGIACIIVSVVDGKGNAVSLQTCPRPSPDGYQEILSPGNLNQFNGDESSKFISPVDFEQLTTTKEYQPSRMGAKGPGPAFLFQFNIWERGNSDIAHLITKLQGAVHHALCDVIMEYRILTAPLASLPPEVLSGLKSNSNQAPLSPTGVLRAELFRKLGPTSNPVIPQTVPVKKRSFSVGETDMRSLWKNFHLKTSESSSLTSYSPITPPEMPRSAEPSQHPATHPVKILKRSAGSTPKSPSISSTDSGSKSSKRQLIFDRREVEPSSDHSPLPSHPTTPTKAPSAEPSPRVSSKEEPSWQTREQERRHNEELNKHLREAEDGRTGRLHWVYTNLARQWLDFEKESQICSVHKMTEKLQSRFSVDLVLLSLVTKLPQVCADTTFKLFQKTKEGFTLYQPPGPKKNRFSSSQGQHRNIPKPGTQENFVLIGRNIHQWRYSLDYRLTEEDSKAPDLVNPQSRKSFQQFDPCDLRSPCNSDLSKLLSIKGHTQSLHLVPRQRLLILYVRDKELTLYTYNWSAELVHSFEAFFHRLIMWHNSRSHLVDCLAMQKMGLYHHKSFGDTGQKDNPFCKYMSEIDSLVKQLLPPTQSTSTHGPSTSLPRPQRKRHPILPPFDETMAVGKIPRPLHMSHFNAWTDPVLRHGAQLQEICNQTRRESDIQMKLQTLYTVWQQKRAYQQPISFDTLETLKQQSRLLTHCATPILFSPQWRKHALQDHHDSEPVSQSPGSPVHEETWHVSLRLSFLQQYIQYLTMNRFHVIETTPDSPRRSFSLTNRISREGGRNLPEGHGRRVKTTTVKYMQITVLGGIILAELSFEHVFFCVKLYAFESSRLPRELNINSRLGMLFTDECDSFKDLIHLHSFSYDFHLRTVQDYLSSPEMGFKMQYHVTSFLSDFVKFFNPIPRFCKNVIHSETQGFLSHNTPAPDLYDYLTKHKFSEFFILHMARSDASEEQEQESALVSFNRGQFTDNLSRRNFYPDEISVSFIISWDQKEYESSTRPGTPVPGYICEAAALSNQSESEKNKNLMRLKYYMIVNSMKQLYPERGRGLTLGMGAMAGAEADLLAMERNPRYVFTKNEMEKKRDLVKELVSQAATYCRRDMLWDKLLKYETDSVVPSKKSKKKDTNEGMVELAISYAEFKVLLESVIKMSLTTTDDRLVALLDNSRPWYENLLHSLRVKFNVMARYFKSEDGMIHQLALLNQTYKCMMVLLTVDFQANAVELDAVYKAQQDWNAGSRESQNQEDLCCQKHVEMVINAICFHLWTSIL